VQSFRAAGSPVLARELIPGGRAWQRLPAPVEPSRPGRQTRRDQRREPAGRSRGLRGLMARSVLAGPAMRRMMMPLRNVSSLAAPYALMWGHIAEYLHLSEGGRRRPIKHRSARSGWPQRYPLPAESCGTAAVSPFAILGCDRPATGSGRGTCGLSWPGRADVTGTGDGGHGRESWFAAMLDL
jgi:hypothetical protein